MSAVRDSVPDDGDFVIVLLATSDIRKVRSRNCPQSFGTGPIDQGGTRHGGSAAWISRTSVVF